MSKKLAALAIMLTLSGFYAFATLGELGRRVNGGERPLLTHKKEVVKRSFSLKSGYQFRGSQVINLEKETASITTIQLNTTVNYRMGGITYVAPLNRKVAVNITSQNKVSSATVKFNF